jgi:prevent-host-death family protein
MLTVPIHEAKAKLSSLIAAVEKGEEVVLTRHGKRVVRLTAEAEAQPDVEARRAKAQELWKRLEALRASIAPAVPGVNDLQTILAANKADLERRGAGR